MKKKTFTLVELLVVLAVIGILASLLLPGLGKARKKALRILCANNMSQIMKASYMFSDDNNDLFPHRYSGGISYDDQLSGYDGRETLSDVEKADSRAPVTDNNANKIYLCPTSPSQPAAFLDSHGESNRHYAISRWGNGNTRYPGVSGRQSNQISSTSDAIAFTESLWCFLGDNNDAFYSRLLWLKLIRSPDFGEGNEFHERKSNYVMADGHIEYMNYWSTLRRSDGTVGDKTRPTGTYWDAAK